jgi:DNA-binding SARP family transcriptional activator
VLGPPVIHTEVGGSPVGFGRRAVLPVLVFLAVYPDGASSADLAAALWPGVRPHPTHRVHTTVSHLRGALPGGHHSVLLAGDRYHLNPARIGVDLWQLHAALDRAGAATGDPVARRRALRTVVGLYTGELAAGQPWPWLDTPREALRRRVLDAVTALAGTEPDPAAAAALWAAAARIDPHNRHLKTG